MKRLSILLGVTVLALLPSLVSSGEAADSTATVHLEVVDAFFGEVIEEFKVRSFKRLYDNADFAPRFKESTASKIPYGTYRLVVFAPGFSVSGGFLIVP